MANELVLVGFYYGILVYSVIIHEVSHGVMALWLGDLTAKYAGRLTFRPWPHIDLLGSILLPLILLLSAGFSFGYAKPVPYNPYNLRDQKWGPLKVALAGPGSNFLVACVAIVLSWMLPLSLIEKQDVLARFFAATGQATSLLERFTPLAEVLTGSLAHILFGLLLMIIFWNVVLGCFNLIPIPPLDGSKILSAIFPISEATQRLMEEYGFFVLIFLVILVPGPMSAFISVFLKFFFGLVV